VFPREEAYQLVSTSASQLKNRRVNKEGLSTSFCIFPSWAAEMLLKLDEPELKAAKVDP
jgi:hypothetical protein